MKPILFTLSVVALLAGCSSDNLESAPQPDEYQGTPVPLVVRSAGIEAEVTSRAAVTVGSIGVFLEGQPGTTGYTQQNNIEYTATAGVWGVKVPAQTLYLGGEKADVCAYLKSTQLSNLSDKASVTLTTQKYNADLDLVYAKNQPADGTGTGKNVTFTMGHAYAKLTLTLTRDNYPNTCKVTTITLKNAAFKSATTLNMATGVYAAGTVNASFVYQPNGATGILVPATPGNQVVELMVVPTPLTNTGGVGLTLVLNVDGKDMTATVDYGKLGGLLAGTNHQLAVSMKGTTLGVTVNSTPWTDVPVTGTILPEP